MSGAPTIKMRHIEFPYDFDPKRQGFFWPSAEQKRRDYFAVKRTTPAVAEAVYQCRPGAKVGSIFVESDFRYYIAPRDLELGIKHPAVRDFCQQGHKRGQGWDTALTAEASSDSSACITIMLRPCTQYHREENPAQLGPCDQHYDILILDVWKAKLETGDLTVAVREQHQKWEADQLVIERRASGIPIIQALARSSIPIMGIEPFASKRDRAINGGGGAGSVQGTFRMGRVLFPRFEDGTYPAWLPEFVREIKDFTGERGAKDDQVDAMVHIINWAIQIGTAGVMLPSEWQDPAAVDGLMQVDHHPLRAFEQFEHADVDPQGLMMAGIADDPFVGMCGRCKHFNQSFCHFHRQPVSELHPGCDQYDDNSQAVMLGY